MPPETLKWLRALRSKIKMESFPTDSAGEIKVGELKTGILKIASRRTRAKGEFDEELFEVEFDKNFRLSGFVKASLPAVIRELVISSSRFDREVGIYLCGSHHLDSTIRAKLISELICVVSNKTFYRLLPIVLRYSIEEALPEIKKKLADTRREQDPEKIMLIASVLMLRDSSGGIDYALELIKLEAQALDVTSTSNTACLVSNVLLHKNEASFKKLLDVVAELKSDTRQFFLDQIHKGVKRLGNLITSQNAHRLLSTAERRLQRGFN